MGAVVTMPGPNTVDWTGPTVEVAEGVATAAPDVVNEAAKLAATRSVADQVGFLLQHVGPRLTAGSLGLRDARQLTKWWQGDAEPRTETVLRRLHLLFEMAYAVTAVYGGATAARFLRSAQPALDGRAPGAVLGGESDPDESGPLVLAALRAFLEG